MTEYDTNPFREHHKPTGIRLVQPEWAPHGMPQGPWTLRSGPDANWAADLMITRVWPERRALTLGVSYNGLQDAERFRRKFGELHSLDRVVPAAPSGPAPWDATLVEVFATLFFILADTEGFELGRPAYADAIELKAPELPAELRGTVVINKYAQASS